MIINAGADLTQMDLPSLAPEFEGEDLSRQTDWWRFVKLDSMDRPGLTKEEFRSLFIKCDACMLITMHMVFRSHHCDPNTAGYLTD